MTRLRKRRAALAALALLLAAVAALAFGLFPQEPLRALAERRLRDALGPGVHVGSLRVFPAGLRAEIRDLTIDTPFFRARVPKARVALSPEMLLGGVLSFRSLYLEYPLLSFGATGSTEPAGPFARPVVVRSLGIVGGTVEYRDPRGAGVRVASLHVRGGIGEGVLEAAAAVGWLGTGRVDRPIPFVARFRISPLLDLDVDNFEAVTPMSRLHVSGSLGRVGALRPDVRLDARLDLEELSALFGTPRARGVLAGEGRCTGTERSLSIDIALSGDRLELAGWPLDRGTARLSHVTGEESRTTAAMSLDLLGGHLESEARLRASVAEGRLKVSAIDLDRLSRAGRLSGPALHGALSGELGFNGNTTADVSVQARFSAAHTQPGLGLRAEGEASGRVRVPDRSLDLDWTTRAEGDGAPGDGSVLRLASMRVVAHGHARGPLPPNIDGTLEGAVGLDSPTGAFAVPVSGSLRFDGRRTSASIEAKQGQGTLTVSADWRGAVADRLQLRAESLDLSWAARDARGRAGLAFDASGPLEALTGRGKVVIEDLVWRELTVGTVTAEIDSRKGQAEVALDVPGLRVTGHGRLRMARDAVLRSTLVFSGTPLTPPASLLPEKRPLAGTLTATVESTAPLAKPEGLEAYARIEALDLASGAHSVKAAGPFEARYAFGRVSVEGLRLEGSGLSMEVSGRAGLDASAPLDARIAGEVDLSRVPQPAGWVLGGTTVVDATLAGTLGHPRAEGQIAARGVTAEASSLPQVSIPEGRVELDGETVALRGVTASVAGGSVTITGRLPLAALLPARVGGPPAPEASLDFTWQGIDAGVLFQRLRPGVVAVGASLAGKLHLEGRLDSLRELRGTLSAPETRFDVQDVALTISPATVRLANGRIETDGITLATPGGSFGASGSVDLIGRGVDVAGKGVLELRTLSPFLAEASMTGTADLDLEVKGSLDDPRPQGTVRLHDGTLRLRAMPQALTAIDGTVVFGGQSLRIEQASANLGGGTVTLSGDGKLESAMLSDVRVEIMGRDMALRYPEGLRSRIDADLLLTGKTRAFLLSGTARARRGLYALDRVLEKRLLAAAPRPVESALLRSIALDLRVVIENPIHIDNNLATLDTTGNITLRGDLERPLPFGRLELGEGGKVYLQHEFKVLSGHLTYDGTWDPSLAVEAERKIENVNLDEVGESRDVLVAVRAEGSLGAPHLSFRSEPPMSESEIVTVIATGRKASQALGSTELIAGQQAATILAGRVSRGLQRGVRGLGLDEVSIQPELLAREADPSARFTFGKQVTRHVKLVYSLGLSAAEERFIQLKAGPVGSLTGSVKRRDEGTFAYEAGQELRIGAPASRRRREKQEETVRLSEVRVETAAPLREETLREWVRARPGRRVSSFDVQDDAERVRSRLREEGYLEAEVGARLEGSTAIFRVRPGPRYTWRVEGMTAPPSLEGEVRDSLFEEEALENGRRRLLRTLWKRGHLRATVATRAVDTEEGERQLVFTVRPGPVLSVAEVRFQGASALSPRALLRAAGGPATLVSSPEEALEGLRSAYQEKLYLGAEIGLPAVRDDGGSVRIVVPVTEGPRAQVASVRFEGATLPEQELAGIAQIGTGAAYDAERVTAAADALRKHYLTRGFPAIRIYPGVAEIGSDIDVVFRITEGDRARVAGFVIRGLHRTKESLVRSRIDIEPGDPLDPRKLAGLERRILELGVFSRVVVTASPESPSTVTIEVQEGPAVVAQYSVGYEEEKKAKGLVDGEVRNLLGLGVALGARHERFKDLRQNRASLHVPAIAGGALTVAAGRERRATPAVDLSGEPFDNVATTDTLELQHKLDLPDRWKLLYGPRFRRTHLELFIGDFRTQVASFSVSAIRETRDDSIDPRRGRFLSFSFEMAPRGIGSQLNFLKGFANASIARELGSSFVWGQAYRLGIAHPLAGQDLDCPALLKAGGSNSVRGFATNTVGPLDPLCGEHGGEAVVVLNQEVRYRHRSGIGAALFYDGGNVFERVRDLSFDLRHSVGAGLRYDSPVGLLRLDVGFPLGRREGEKHQFFFNLGQAF